MLDYELIQPVDNQRQLIEQILLNRGITDIKSFLFLEDYMPPSGIKTLKNLKEGAIMLIQHIHNGDKIFVQVDSDVDGLTSAATLINYLNQLFPNYAQTKIEYKLHDEKTHGLDTAYIPIDTKLIIIPDAGSSEYDLHKKCKELGYDILILDHHQADKESEYACVINNQLCDYPNKALSGVGVVYKFCKYIDSLLGVDYADKYLDLVSLGLIADMMDTREYETQALIQTGLKSIRNPLFIELMKRDGMHFSQDKTPTMTDVAWYIAPILNAVTRIGSQDEKNITFQAMLEFLSYQQIPSTKRGAKGTTETRAEQASRTAANVKSHQGAEVDKGIIFIDKQIQEEELFKNKIIPICIQDSRKLNKNLNGLVANKLSSEYQRPALILHRYIHDLEVYWEGSARGYDKSLLKDFRQFVLDSGLVEYAQGHENAFGIGIKDENMTAFIEYCNENLTMLDGTIKYNVDFIWDAKALNPTDIINIANYKYLWGQKVEEPKIAIENIKLTDETINFIGKNGKTMRIDLPNNVNMIKFFVKDEEKETLNPDGETWFATAIVTCDINEWNGRTSPQLKLLELDVTRKQKWYF